MESPISESRFNMWRAILAIAYKTEHLTPDDRVALEAALSRKGIAEDRYKIIHDEILKPSPLADVLKNVSDEEDVLNLCEISRLFYWSGGDVEKQNEAIKAELGSDFEKAGVSIDTALESSAACVERVKNDFDEKSNLLVYVYTVFPHLKDLQPAISDSEMNMWRAVFAIAHADEKVTGEEEKFLRNVLETVPFNKVQRTILQADIKIAQSVDDAFSRITDQLHRSRFFYIARLLCWCDGDFDKQEQAIIAKLNTLNFKTVDFEKLVKDVDMSFVDQEAPQPLPAAENTANDDKQKTGFFSKIMGKKKK